MNHDDGHKGPNGSVALVVLEIGDDPSRVVDRLERLCGDGSKDEFGVLVDTTGYVEPDADPERGARSGRIAEVRRLRSLRPAMQSRCRGVAFVTRPEDLRHQRRRVRAARAMLGCDVSAFDGRSAGLGWLADHGVAVGDLPATDR